MLFKARLCLPFEVRSKTRVKNKKEPHHIEYSDVNLEKLTECGWVSTLWLANTQIMAWLPRHLMEKQQGGRGQTVCPPLLDRYSWGCPMIALISNVRSASIITPHARCPLLKISLNIKHKNTQPKGFGWKASISLLTIFFMAKGGENTPRTSQQSSFLNLHTAVSHQVSCFGS